MPFARFVASLDDVWQADIEVLLVVRALYAQATVTATLVAPLIQRSIVEAERLLSRLADDERPLRART